MRGKAFDVRSSSSSKLASLLATVLLLSSLFANTDVVNANQSISNTLAAAPIAKPSNSSNKPAIQGVPAQGERLYAEPGALGANGAKLRYQWKRNGVAITGAISSTYKLTSADVGKLVTVTLRTATGKTNTTASVWCSRPIQLKLRSRWPATYAQAKRSL